MKQIYTHTQLLALRHECQEESARNFFASCRAQLFYLELQSGITYRGHSPSLYASPHPKVHVRYALRHPSGINSSVSKNACDGQASIYPGPSNTSTRMARFTVKDEAPPWESFQLVKIPLSLGELPQGSKIIRVRPGIRVPDNAIPVSITEVTSEQAPQHVPTSQIHEPRSKEAHGYQAGHKWAARCEVPGTNGIPYFAATSSENLLYYAPYGADDVGPGSGTATKPGAASGASSEAVVSPEVRFQYAPFFEPYMRKHVSLGSVYEGNKPKIALRLLKSDTLGATITPSTSYESDSATEYSSDSSNVHIQLPV